MTLLDLVQQDGIQAKKVAGTNGGEYAGSCPSCGGEDRFHVWPEQGDGGRYWCRGCSKHGDTIQYLRDFRKLKYLEACFLLAREPRESKRSLNWSRRSGDKDRSETWQPRETAKPRALWQTKASSFMERAESILWTDRGKEAREWFHGRGLSDETIRAFRLGWNFKNWWADRQSWGLPEELNDKGNPKRLWIPRGWSIPRLVGEWVVSLKIRRPDKDLEGKDDPKYVLISGSETAAFIITGGPACIIVESELDAILLHQEARDLASVVALGSASIRPDQSASNLINNAETILNCLDSDEAGARQVWQWWAQHFPRAKRWPVIGGKDPTEAKQHGLDLRAWVLAGLSQGSLPVSRITKLPEPAAYPNQDGLVVCEYCDNYRDHRCNHGHHPDGISLLRECGEFGFEKEADQDFCRSRV